MFKINKVKINERLVLFVIFILLLNSKIFYSFKKCANYSIIYNFTIYNVDEIVHEKFLEINTIVQVQQ